MTRENEIYDGCNSSDCGHWGCFDMNEKDAEIESMKKERDDLKAKVELAERSNLLSPRGWIYFMGLEEDNEVLREQNSLYHAKLKELEGALKEIEERTRPQGDMADQAVNGLAKKALGESEIPRNN